MTPTLFGRLQSRVFLLATFGVLWTLIVVPILPRPDGASIGDIASAAFRALLVIGAVGLIWEGIYHLLQQIRWEKDWPSLFGLLTGINEGIVAFLILGGAGLTFFVHFTTTWIVVWLAAHGPMRVLFPRWRFRGGRLV